MKIVRMSPGARLRAFSLALAAGSCAGGQTALPPPSVGPLPPTATSPGGAPGPPQPWSAMTTDQRRNYMKAIVFPRMKELFVAFNSARYEKMSCKTCHGQGETDGTFKMPDDQLPKLPGSPEGFKRLAADKPAMCQFMLTRVKPTMATLLGLPEVSAETSAGFGCGRCHAK